MTCGIAGFIYANSFYRPGTILDARRHLSASPCLIRRVLADIPARIGQVILGELKR
jgi:hypothetical protein